MMSQAFLKQLGVLGITLGLVASPLAVAQQTYESEPEASTAPADEPAFDSEAEPMPDASEPGGDPASPGSGASTAPVDEPGFGGGTEPMPGTSEPGSDPAEQLPKAEEPETTWEEEESEQSDW